MLCPQCKSEKTGVLATRLQEDGTTLRRRHCKSCLARFSSFEVEAKTLVKEPVEPARPDLTKVMAAACPLARQKELFDLELAMEDSLLDAIHCVRETLGGRLPPDKVVTDLAKWLIEDRRAWRKALAEQSVATGEVHEDPAVAQLANVLRLVP
jgi:hypothetical protein